MNAIPDPAEDNKKMLAFIDAQALAPSRSWIQQSPWSIWVLDVIERMIRLNQWHFKETGDPFFCIRALHVGQHLSPDDSRLAWAREWRTNALGQLNALIDQPRPPEKGKHREAILSALGFSTDPYENPISKVRHIVEKDKIYVEVLRHGKPVTGPKGAFQTVADRLGLGSAKVKETYYERKRLVDSLTQ